MHQVEIITVLVINELDFIRRLEPVKIFLKCIASTEEEKHQTFSDNPETLSLNYQTSLYLYLIII